VRENHVRRARAMGLRVAPFTINSAADVGAARRAWTL
jgi:hypothetical protein